MHGKLHGKRKPAEGDDGDQEAPKRYKATNERHEAACRAMAYVRRLDEMRAKWYCNLNKWQDNLSDPGFEANRLLLEPWVPGLKLPRYTMQSETANPADDRIMTVPTAAEMMPHMPTFCGVKRGLFFKVALPLEFYVGQWYVYLLFVAMGFTANGCIRLINEYYDPVCPVAGVCLTDDNNPNATVRRLYLLKANEGHENAADVKFLADFTEQLFKECRHTLKVFRTYLHGRVSFPYE